MLLILFCQILHKLAPLDSITFGSKFVRCMVYPHPSERERKCDISNKWERSNDKHQRKNSHSLSIGVNRHQLRFV